MTKRKPQKVVVHRIEFQTKERELFEQFMYLEQLNKLIDSLLSMDPKIMYMYITILEGVGLIDTPIPTLSDAPSTDEVLNAIHTIFTNRPVVGADTASTRDDITPLDAIIYRLTGQYPERFAPN
tara:strand:+ start:438 stop:809 length:372 start_codon:yes stop_codon:yes gene_type:complete